MTTAAPGPDHPSLRTRARRWWQNVVARCATPWRAIRPGPEARRGAVGGTLAAAAACVVIAGLYLQSGFGYAFDFAFVILCAAVLIPLVAWEVGQTRGGRPEVQLVETLDSYGQVTDRAYGFVVGAAAPGRKSYGPAAREPLTSCEPPPW